MSLHGAGIASSFFVRLLAVLAAIALLTMPFVAKKLIEKFDTSNFATAVIAQNKQAFDRLAEM